MSQFSDLDKKRLNNVLSSVIRASTMERFKTSRTPEGKRWEPSKRAEQEAGKTLAKPESLADLRMEFYMVPVFTSVFNPTCSAHLDGSQRIPTGFLED